jgi:hypothetical protein
VDPRLATHASANYLAAYTFLLTAPSLVVGDWCGLVGEPTQVWQTLTSLVHARETAMLQELAARASTFEARAAAVVGLVKVGAVSKGEAVVMLASLGTITTCGGCEVSERSVASDIAYLFDVPLVGEPRDTTNPELLELPGTVPIPRRDN